MNQTINVATYIRTAAASKEMRSRARLRVAQMVTAGDLLAYQGRSQNIRASDFGSCRLALWADMHDLNDIARDPIDDQLTRLDVGSLMGAWLGALLEQGAVDDGWDVMLEYVPSTGGHIDALMRRRCGGCNEEGDGSRYNYSNEAGDGSGYNYGTPCSSCDGAGWFWAHVVEFKTGYDTAVAKDDNMAHQLQAARYAHATNAAQFTLVYVKVAAPKGKRIAQFTFDAEAYREPVAQEITRLESALGADAPTPDPVEVWRCYTCRYGACDRNKNKAKDDTGARDLEELFA